MLTSHPLLRNEQRKKGESVSDEELRAQGQAFNATERDLREAKELAKTLTLDETKQLVKSIHKQHVRDPNFPIEIIESIEKFLGQYPSLCQ